MRLTLAVVLSGVLVATACTGSASVPQLGRRTVTVAGTARDGTSKVGLAGVAVTVHYRYFDPDEGENLDALQGRTRTAADGTYSFRHLFASTDYVVCFYALGIEGPNAATGYGNRCYPDVAWDNPGIELDDPAVLAQTVSGGRGDVLTVDQPLPRISVGTLLGHVTTRAGTAVVGVRIDLTPANGDHHEPAAETLTDSDGAYSLRMPVGSHEVCFHARSTDRPEPQLLHSCLRVVVRAGHTIERDPVLHR